MRTMPTRETSVQAPVDYERMKALALAATPGPWEYGRAQLAVFNTSPVDGLAESLVAQCSQGNAAANAEFIAAFNPQTAIALLSERDTAHARIAALEQVLRNIRLSAAGARAYGLHATPISDEKMIERRNRSLDDILRFCGDAGFKGSILRAPPTPTQEARTMTEETPVATEKLTDAVLLRAYSAFISGFNKTFKPSLGRGSDVADKAGAAAMRAVLAPVLAPLEQAEAELALIRVAAHDETLSDGAARAVARGVAPVTADDVTWARAVLAGRAETPRQEEALREQSVPWICTYPVTDPNGPTPTCCGNPAVVRSKINGRWFAVCSTHRHAEAKP